MCILHFKKLISANVIKIGYVSDNMKTIFLIVSTLVQLAFAEQVTRTLQVCSESIIEDICWDNRVQLSCRRQLIVTGLHSKMFFSSQNLVQPNIHGEYLLANLKQVSHQGHMVDETQAYKNNGRVLYVKPGFHGYKTITVESFRTTQASGGRYLQLEKVGEFIFRNCN
jgi:hypothetical protein